MVKPHPSKLGKRKAAGAPAKAAPNKANAGKAGKAGKAGAAAERETGPTGKPRRRADQPKKVKRRDMKTIPVPRTVYASAGGGGGSDEDEDEDEDDVGMDGEVELEAFRTSGFLESADVGALSRSVKETRRLHQLQKDKAPRAAAKAESDAGSDALDYDFDSDLELSDDGAGSGDGEASDDDLSGAEDEDEDEDEDGDDDNASELGSSDLASDLDSDMDSDINSDALSFTSGSSTAARAKKRRAPEGEAEYEAGGRARWAAAAAVAAAGEPDSVEVGRLPIKLPTGEVRAVAGSTRVALAPAKRPRAVVESDEEEVEEDEEELAIEAEVARMAGQKGRFGRLAAVDVVRMGKGRLEAAKEQIAAIGAEILAGGELVDIAPTLTRLSTFALATVPDPETGAALAVPNSMRAFALLSQLAVYKDLVPGYRIRALTETEEAEKVRDEVRRLREGEKALVRSYRGYLKTLETEVKRKTPLASLALRCLADLLSTHPHFNFAENIMAVLVARVGRRSWDGADADACLAAFVTLFRADLTGEHSRALVRLLARMIKERKYQVHANVLGCLLHLRLRTELNPRDHERDKRGKGKGRFGKYGKGKDKEVKVKDKSEVRRVWRTKNERKREKEMKEIRKEMDEAEAEVDVEERQTTQTETLKDLFVLYFSILKHPGRSPLLPAALEGISHFAHLINIDFFRDLLLVLRRLIADTGDASSADAGPTYTPRPTPSSVPLDAEAMADEQRTRLRLLAIVTAFDLLGGQGEALNIDLADFVNALYALLPALSTDTAVEDPPAVSSAAAAAPAPSAAPASFATGPRGGRVPAHTQSTAELAFRSLDAVFFPRFVSQANAAPAYRTAAFAKRLAECALACPPATARRCLEFVRRLLVREPKVEALLDTEERAGEGTYRPESGDPQIANAWATSLWEVEALRSHYDGKVRAEARRLAEGRYA